MSETAKRGFSKWLEESYLSSWQKKTIVTTQAAIGSVAEIASGIVTIIGIPGAIIKILQFLDLMAGDPDKLDLIRSDLNAIDNVLRQYVEWDTAANWNQVLAPLDVACLELSDMLRGAGTTGGARPGLLNDTDRQQLYFEVIGKLRTVRFVLLPTENNQPSAFQRAVNPAPSNYRPDLNEWHWHGNEGITEGRVDPAAVGLEYLPILVPPVEWGNLGPGDMWWDYRRALLHIVRTVAALITAYKIYDPAFRTTGRFKMELEAMIADLEFFAARWLGCLHWTNLRPISRHFDDDDFGGVNHPRAIDSRSLIQFARYSEENLPGYWFPMPSEPEYSLKRREYAMNVVNFSGLRSFVDLIEELRDLTRLPVNSESVAVDVRVTGVRSFLRAEQRRRGTTVRNVKLYQVDWHCDCQISVQPKEAPFNYALNLPIEYEFWLETYESLAADGAPEMRLTRVRLWPGDNQRIGLRVNSADLWVPTESDESFSRGLDPRHTSRLQGLEEAGFGPQRVTGAFDSLKTFGELNAIVSSDRVKNKRLTKVAEMAEAFSAFDMVVDFPRGVQAGESQLVDAQVAVSFDFGSSGDPGSGLVRIRIWTLDDVEVNLGALFLVIEEKPPVSPNTIIRTLVPLRMNSLEIWYPAFSRQRDPWIPVDRE